MEIHYNNIYVEVSISDTDGNDFEILVSEVEIDGTYYVVSIPVISGLYETLLNLAIEQLINEQKSEGLQYDND